MKNPMQPESAQRREFLRQCAVIGGSATVVVAAGGVAADTVEQAPGQVAGNAQPQGYRLTPHIKEYYEKASV